MGIEIVAQEHVEALLNQKEVAEILKVSTKTLEYYRWKGLGPRFLKVGRHVRYRPVDLIAYLEEKIELLERKKSNLNN
jgi:DNA-binding transcriptional MerR regulator